MLVPVPAVFCTTSAACVIIVSPLEDEVIGRVLADAAIFFCQTCGAPQSIVRRYVSSSHQVNYILVYYLEFY